MWLKRVNNRVKEAIEWSVSQLVCPSNQSFRFVHRFMPIVPEDYYCFLMPLDILYICIHINLWKIGIIFCYLISLSDLRITFNLSYTDIFTLIVMLSDSQCWYSLVNPLVNFCVGVQHKPALCCHQSSWNRSKWRHNSQLNCWCMRAILMWWI